MCHFFEVYKRLENKTTAVDGEVKGREQAVRIIRAAIESYSLKFSQ